MRQDDVASRREAVLRMLMEAYRRDAGRIELRGSPSPSDKQARISRRAALGSDPKFMISSL